MGVIHDWKGQPDTVKMSYTEPAIHEFLSDRLGQIMSQVPVHQQIVIVCIGTDRSTGDSLGPLVGSYLHKHSAGDIALYGTLDEPVHALNLEDTLHKIMDRHKQPFIIAIDACLGQLASVGAIQIGKGPLQPGAGVNKKLPPVGNIHITGIVNVGGFMEYFVLQNTRLSLVIKMAEVISQGLYSSIMKVRRSSVSSLQMLEQ